MSALTLTIGSTNYVVDPNTPMDGGVFGSQFGPWLTAASQTITSGIGTISGNGVVAKTGTGTFSARTVTGTANQITVTNGDGVSGNPTLTLPSAITAPGSLTVTTTTALTGDVAVNTNKFTVAASSGNTLVAGTLNVTGVITSAGDHINFATKTPASAAAAGTAGDVAWDASYVYVCVATNTWKRAAIATW